MPRAAPSDQERAPAVFKLEAGPTAGDTLVAAALKILQQPSSDLKAAWTQHAAQLWHDGLLRPPMFAEGNLNMQPADTPARDSNVRLACH